MKRGIAILIVSALLLGGLGLAAEPWPSRAATFITLGAGGWSDPSVGTWDAATMTGTLVRDVAQGIQITADGIVLEGNGHTLSGSGSAAGVYLNRRSGVTVRNVTAKGFQYGIFLYYANNNQVSGNSVSGNASHGIYLDNSSGNVLAGNSSSGNKGDGFQLKFSPGNTLTGNSASGNPSGICLSSSANNTLSGNTMAGNTCDFRVDAESDYDYGQNIDATNRVGANGKSLYYLCNQSGVTVPADAGAVYLIRCSNITLRDLVLSGSQAGVLLWQTSNSRLENIQAAGTSVDFWLRYSNGNTLANNTAGGSNYAGIYLESSNDNTLTGNTVRGHRPYGLLLSGGTRNVAYNNRFLDNGMHASVSGDGNVFSQPKPKGGNYWDVWTSPDADGDGIVDNPYHFDISQVDEYPWANPDGWLVLPPPATPTPEPTIGATFVTGGGWIKPPQASTPGKAHVEVVCRYAEGAETPTGKVDLQLGKLQFHSTAFTTLVVDGGQAWCRGQGTANDGATYSFVLAVAGARGRGKSDRMRIKVWDEATGLVLYDSEPGADEWAVPEVELGGGSLTIHKD